MSLLVKRLHDAAKLPTVAYPGEDLGYDIYALEDVSLDPFHVTVIRTGIAIEQTGVLKTGFLMRDRSSMAKVGVGIFGGTIDAGYRGEVTVLMRNLHNTIFDIKAGDKIAQLVPIPVFTESIFEVKDLNELSESRRGAKGFGSSGK